MAWVIGIGIFVLLLFSFPRQTIALCIGAIVIVAAALIWIHQADVARRETEARERALLGVSVLVDRSICADARFPLVVTIRNNSNEKTLISISISIDAYIPNYSNSVVFQSIESDRIILPRQIYQTCWAVRQPPPTGMDYDALIWSASIFQFRWR